MDDMQNLSRDICETVFGRYMDLNTAQVLGAIEMAKVVLTQVLMDESQTASIEPWAIDKD